MRTYTESEEYLRPIVFLAQFRFKEIWSAWNNIEGDILRFEMIHSGQWDVRVDFSNTLDDREYESEHLRTIYFAHKAQNFSEVVIKGNWVRVFVHQGGLGGEISLIGHIYNKIQKVYYCEEFIDVARDLTLDI